MSEIPAKLLRKHPTLVSYSRIPQLPPSDVVLLSNESLHGAIQFAAYAGFIDVFAAGYSTFLIVGAPDGSGFFPLIGRCRVNTVDFFMYPGHTFRYQAMQILPKIVNYNVIINFMV